MAQARVRRTPPQSIAPRGRRRRRHSLRAVLTLLALLVAATLAGRAYLLSVYAPGLRAEVRMVPGIVRSELAHRGEPYTPTAAISPDMRHAIVAIEDRRFYLHPGIDPVGMIRALIVNLNNQHVDQGGSTLEEQLAKRAIVGDDRTLHGKLRTIGLAWALDQEFSKAQILEMYLNAAYYGQGAYGIGAAAHTYFGTDPAHLSVGQAAFLAALPQAPSVYGSDPHAQIVHQRWKQVLADMLAAQYITPGQEQRALHTPLTFTLPAT